jgi:hypothetical protein
MIGIVIIDAHIKTEELTISHVRDTTHAGVGNTRTERTEQPYPPARSLKEENIRTPANPSSTARKWSSASTPART